MIFRNFFSDNTLKQLKKRNFYGIIFNDEQEVII